MTNAPPDNDVLRLYKEVAELKRMVERQNILISERDRQLERFVRTVNEGLGKIEIISELMKETEQILPILKQYFDDINKDLQI